MAEAQTHASHKSVVPAYHYYMFAVVVINLFWTLYQFGHELLGGNFSFDLLLSFLVAGVLVVIFIYMRFFPLAVQDRVIRLEMKLRLNEILPDDLKGRIDDLSRAQLMAIRFAGDAEMPDLVRDVLDNNVTDRAAIKGKVKDWQPDHWRC